MKTTTFYCSKCGWIGEKPSSFRVSGGHSYWPIRDLCPECFYQRNDSVTVAVNWIVPKPEFYQISDENRLFSSLEALEILNFPDKLEYFLINICQVKLTRIPAVLVNGRWLDYKISKRELDALVKRVNERHATSEL